MNIISWILLAVGILVLGAAIFKGVSNYRWLSDAEVTEGEVVELIEKRGKKGKRSYKPRVEFKVSGQVREYVSGVSSNPPSYKVGEKVRMAYSSDHDKSTIVSFGHIYGFSLIGGMVGLVLIIGVAAIANGGLLLQKIHPNLG